MRPRTAHASSGSALPRTRTTPSVGRNSVASTRSRVDFPAPLGPKTTSVRPGGSTSVTPARATRSP